MTGEWRHLAKLNWKGRVARIHAYFQIGDSTLQQFKSLVYVSAALKILGLPLIWIAALAPCLVLFYILFGFWWVNRGLYRQQQEISLVDNFSIPQRLQWWIDVKMAQALGIDVTAMNLRHLPPEVLHHLASKPDQVDMGR